MAARDDEAVTANSGRIWSPGTGDGQRRRRGPTAGEGIGEAERNSGGGSEWEEPTAALGARGGDGGRTMAPTGSPSCPNLPLASRGLRHPPEVRKTAVSVWDHCGRHSHLTDSGSAGSSGGGGGGGSGRGQSGGAGRRGGGGRGWTAHSRCSPLSFPRPSPPSTPLRVPCAPAPTCVPPCVVPPRRACPRAQCRRAHRRAVPTTPAHRADRPCPPPIPALLCMPCACERE